MDEYEVRNRHGDVVQRGVAEVRDVHEVDTPFGTMPVAEIELRDPAQLRRPGDTLAAVVDLRDLY